MLLTKTSCMTNWNISKQWGVRSEKYIFLYSFCIYVADAGELNQETKLEF